METKRNKNLVVYFLLSGNTGNDIFDVIDDRLRMRATEYSELPKTRMFL